jgi:hypothetical protein
VELSPATFQIRFNTEALKEGGEGLPIWRVLENGQERLARHVTIQVKSWTTTDQLESGLIKHHITCVGVAYWEDEALSIRDA